MTPNVSVLLQRWGVDHEIGDNLVQFEELNMRRKDGTLVGNTKISTLEESLGRPWWVVHRAHLHEGLVKVAERLGAEIRINSGIAKICHAASQQVTVKTRQGDKFTFDLAIGADGINSITRKTLFPDVAPEPPTTNCAYRALVPYDQIRKDPVAKELIEKLTMEVWMGENAYIITYPINGGKMFNLVLSHHRPQKVRATEPNVPIEELHNEYKDFDPRIKRIVNMVEETVRSKKHHHVSFNVLTSCTVSMATHGHRSHEVLVFPTQKRCLDGGCCSFNGQPHGSGRSYSYGRWCLPWQMHGHGC